MPPSTLSAARPQSLGEEIANAISHGFGLVAALATTPFLLARAASHNDPALLIGTSIFAATVILLYCGSTLYHALPRGRGKRIFRLLEHSAIYLLIAGTYTPFALGVLRGPWGWTLFGIAWSLAALGVLLKILGGMRHPRLAMLLYLGLGWLILVAGRPLWMHMPLPGVLWLLAGGLAYTVGLVFYAAHRTRYAHFVWHLFVLAGTVCHFVAVRNYAA